MLLLSTLVKENPGFRAGMECADVDGKVDPYRYRKLAMHQVGQELVDVFGYSVDR